MASPNQPTLLYPNGNENILARVIDIEWKESAPVANDSAAAWYEIYYTENYDFSDEPDWQMIAQVPIGLSKFSWKIGNAFKSDLVRIGIRAVNARGERSPFSVSAANFSIKKSLPNTPSVLSPVPGERYSNNIYIIFDDSAVKDNSSRRAKYYIYFRSAKANIPLSPISQQVVVGSGPLLWDISSLPPADDYIVTVYMSDDDGNKSSEVNITDINIVNEGFFLIDTLPPSAFVQINKGKEYTRDPNVSVRLFAYDETTGPHSFQFSEGGVVGPAEAPTEIKYWVLTEEDGIKTLKVKYQDYGFNRLASVERSFRILFDLENNKIVDVVLQNNAEQDILWIAVNGEEESYIYKGDPSTTFVSNVNEKIVAIGLYNEVLYISVDTADDTAFVYRFTGSGLTEAFSFNDSNSLINAMEGYKNKLYLGSENGILYSYDESSVANVMNFNSPIERLFTDNALLYVVLRNNKQIIIYDGSNFSESNL